MGFMDKLRSMASAVTGGGAKVQLEIEDPSREQPFAVNVQAEVAGNDLKIEKVYVKLVGQETVKVDVEVPAEQKEAPPKDDSADKDKSATTKMGSALAKNKAASLGKEPQSVKPAEASASAATTKEVSRTEITYQQEFEIAGAQTLEANQTYTWSGKIQIPADGKPTYQGINATHEWRVLAGLSAFGNDPDSGWQSLDV